MHPSNRQLPKWAAACVSATRSNSETTASSSSSTGLPPLPSIVMPPTLTVMPANAGTFALENVLTLGSINVLLWFQRMTDIVYRDVLIATVAVYVAGNTLQKIKAKTQEEADA